MRVLLIQHEDAGDGKTAPETIVDALETRGWQVRQLSRKDASGETIAAAAPELVVVAGGDGTVAGVLTMLPDRKVPAAILPTGSANNIARSLGIEGDPAALVARWDLQRRRRFDLGDVSGPWGNRPCAEGVGFGALAESLCQAPDVDGPEKIRAGRVALAEALDDALPVPLKILADGDPLPEDLLMVEILNIGLTGPRLPLAPKADPGDGWLDVAFLRTSAREAMCAWLRGRRRTGAPVETRRAREVTVRGGEVRMRIDDDAQWLEAKSEMVVRLEDEPALIIAPPEDPATLD